MARVNSGELLWIDYFREPDTTISGSIATTPQLWIDYFREPDTTPATERIALLTSVVCGLVITAIFVLFNRVLVGLFVKLDTPAAQLAMEGFPYFSAAFVFFIFNLTVIGYFQSIERMKPATILALLRGFIFLVPSFVILPQLMGTEGIWLALGLSELLTTFVIGIGYATRAHRTVQSSPAP